LDFFTPGAEYDEHEGMIGGYGSSPRQASAHSNDLHSLALEPATTKELLVSRLWRQGIFRDT
jgi:hypothetical protein